MTNDTKHQLFTNVAEAIALFDEILPEVIVNLGADHPDVVAAIEAMEDVKILLRDVGYTPPSLH